MQKNIEIKRRSALKKAAIGICGAGLIGSTPTSAASKSARIELIERTGYKDVDYVFWVDGDVDRVDSADDDDDSVTNRRGNTEVRGHLNGNAREYKFYQSGDIYYFSAGGNIGHGTQESWHPELVVNISQDDKSKSNTWEVRGDDHYSTVDSDMNYVIESSRGADKYCCTEAEDYIHENTINGRVDNGHKDTYDIYGSFQYFKFKPKGARIIVDQVD